MMISQVKKLLRSFNQCYLNCTVDFVIPYSLSVVKFLYFLKIHQLIHFFRIRKNRDLYDIIVVPKYTSHHVKLFYFKIVKNDIFLTSRNTRQLLNRQKNCLFPLICIRTRHGFSFVSNSISNNSSANGQVICSLLPYRT